MRIGQKVDGLQVLILVLVVSVSTVTAVYAVSSSWTATNSIRVTTSSIAVFLDSALSQPVPSSIDWGEYHPGDRIALYCWIHNRGSNPVTLAWTSDLSSASFTGFVSDQWLFSNDGQTWQNLAGQNLAPSSSLQTKYVIQLSTLTPAGTYAWSLTLSGS